MKPKRIILVRHGQSEANADLSILSRKPDYACQLTEKGWYQANKAGHEIRLLIGDERIQTYRSPYWRTRQTLIGINNAISSNQQQTAFEDPRLREQEWGTNLVIDDSRSAIEHSRSSYGHFYYRIPGGESCADVYDRVSDQIGSLFRDFEKDSYPPNVLIVGHGLTLRVWLMRFFKLSVEDFETLANPHNCQVIVITKGMASGKYRLTTDLRKYPNPTHEFQFDWAASYEINRRILGQSNDPDSVQSRITYEGTARGID